MFIFKIECELLLLIEMLKTVKRRIIILFYDAHVKNKDYHCRIEKRYCFS